MILVHFFTHEFRLENYWQYDLLQNKYERYYYYSGNLDHHSNYHYRSEKCTVVYKLVMYYLLRLLTFLNTGIYSTEKLSSKLVSIFRFLFEFFRTDTSEPTVFFAGAPRSRGLSIQHTSTMKSAAWKSSNSSYPQT